MNYTQAIDQVRDVVVKMRYLESIDNIIYCDKWHVCPKDGFSYEADVNAYLAEIRHDQLVNDHVAQLVAYFETVDDRCATRCWKTARMPMKSWHREISV